VLVGNSDVNSLVINKFSPPFVARLVRIHPILQTAFGYLRLEFYGCTGTPDDVFTLTKQVSCKRQNAVLYRDNVTRVITQRKYHTGRCCTALSQDSTRKVRVQSTWMQFNCCKVYQRKSSEVSIVSLSSKRMGYTDVSFGKWNVCATRMTRSGANC